MTLEIINRQRTKRIDARLLKRAALELLSELKIKTAELGINLVGAREITLLNETFLQHEGSTDVITFNHHDGKFLSGNEPSLHGELFICVDEATLQAKRFRCSWQSEIIRYVVHGTLHLLGYDDLTPRLRQKMKREENRLVRRLAKKISFTQLSLPQKNIL